MAIDVARIRQDFPILRREVNGRPLVYLDNAATTQKPKAVIEAIARYYEASNANVHRAIHRLGEEATEQYEEARRKVAGFIGAPAADQVIFTRNATEAINLVAYAWARPRLKAGDAILATPMEHHSNLVPWQQVAQLTGCRLEFLDLASDGTLVLDRLPEILRERRVRLVAVTQVSNVLGTINPVAEIAREARAAGAAILVDGAQSAPHMPVDVEAIGCDFFALSGHKMCGPTGIGVLFGRRERLEEMEPFLFGGDMISQVHLERAEWNDLPYKFEAGTPNIAGAIGLGAAIDYLTSVGLPGILAHEEGLVRYAIERLERLGGIEIHGPRSPRGGLVSFSVEGIHPHDISTFLDSEGIAIRAGHHCAQPLMEWLEVPATNRASFYLYNTEAEVDALVGALTRAKEFFGHVLN